jgi:hypothetical protein
MPAHIQSTTKWSSQLSVTSNEDAPLRCETLVGRLHAYGNALERLHLPASTDKSCPWHSGQGADASELSRRPERCRQAYAHRLPKTSSARWHTKWKDNHERGNEHNVRYLSNDTQLRFSIFPSSVSNTLAILHIVLNRASQAM